MPDRRAGGFFSSALDLDGNGQVTIEDIATNMISILMSWIDWGLHVAFAVWLYINYQDSIYASLAVVTIVVAVIINLLAMVRYILNNTQDPDSNLRDRLQDYPQNSTMVLLLGVINVELLIFLSDDVSDQANFRSLGLLTNIFEGVPMVCLQLAFTHLELLYWHPLIIISFSFTMFTLVLKSLRAWIVWYSQHIDDDEPELLLGENLYSEDTVAQGVAMAAFGLALTQAAWLNSFGGAMGAPDLSGTALGAGLNVYYVVSVASMASLGVGNFFLLTSYLRQEGWAHSLMWKESLSAAYYAFLALFHASALNGFTQDDKQYTEVKVRAILVWLVLFGLPMLVVQTLLAFAFACGTATCGVTVLGASVAFFTLAPLAVLAPCVLYNCCRLVVALAPAGGPEEDGVYLYDEDDVDLVSAPMETEERLPMGLSLWLGLLDVGLHVSAASYFWVRHWEGVSSEAPGARGDGLWAGGFLRVVGDSALEETQTPFAFPAVAFGAIAVSFVCNLAFAARYMLRSSTDSLRATIFNNPGTASLVLATACAGPEACAVLARERQDVDSFRVLSAVGLLTGDVPMLVLLAARVTWWPASPIVVASLTVTTVVLTVKLARAAVVGLSRAHAHVQHQLEPAFFANLRRGDALSWGLTFAHWVAVVLLASALLLHAERLEHATFKDQVTTLGVNSVAAASSFGRALVALLAVCAAANVLVCASFLNHRGFSQGHVSRHSYTSGIISVLGLVDAAVLNCLTQDEVAYRALKRDAQLVYACTLAGPAALALGVLKVVANGELSTKVAWAQGASPLEVHANLLEDAALGLSVAVLAWKFYLWAIIRVTWQSALAPLMGPREGHDAGLFPGREALLEAAGDFEEDDGGSEGAVRANADDETESGRGRKLMGRSKAASGSALIPQRVVPLRPYRHALPFTWGWWVNRYGPSGEYSPPNAKKDEEDEAELEGGTERGDAGSRASPTASSRAAASARTNLPPPPAENGDVVTNGTFEHGEVFPNKGAVCRHGQSLAGWRQVEGQGAIVGAPDTPGPDGVQNAWRLTVHKRANASAAVAQTVRTVAGTRYVIGLRATGSEEDEATARALVVEAVGGDSAESGAPLGSESTHEQGGAPQPAALLLSTSLRLEHRRNEPAAVEKRQWRMYTLSFDAKGERTSIVLRAAHPTSAVYIADVVCAAEGSQAARSAQSAAAEDTRKADAAPQSTPGPLDLGRIFGGGGSASAKQSHPDDAKTPSDTKASAGGFFDGISSGFSSVFGGVMTPRAASKSTLGGSTNNLDARDKSLEDPGAFGGDGPHAPPPRATPPSKASKPRSPRSMAGMDSASTGYNSANSNGGRGGAKDAAEVSEDVRATAVMAGGNALILPEGGDARATSGGVRGVRATVETIRATLEEVGEDAAAPEVNVAIVPVDCIFTRGVTATAPATEGLMVSTANWERRPTGKTPPYFFLPALRVDEEHREKARQRITRGQAPHRIVAYDPALAHGLTPEHIERGVSREPAAAWRAVLDFESGNGSAVQPRRRSTNAPPSGLRGRRNED